MAWVRNPLEESWLLGEWGLFSSTVPSSPVGAVWEGLPVVFAGAGNREGQCGDTPAPVKMAHTAIVGWEWGTLWHWPSWERLSPSQSLRDGIEGDTCGPFPSGPLFLPWGGGKEAPELILCDSLGSGICVCPWFWICLLNSLLLFFLPFWKYVFVEHQKIPVCSLYQILSGTCRSRGVEQTDPDWVCPSQLRDAGFLTKDTKLTETHTKME